MSHEADNVTGSNAGDVSAGSASSPRFSARRHLNTWFAFTPCARATSATLAPGSNVSSAIRRFSDTVRQRRTGRTDPTSPATPMTTYSASHSQSCQRGTRDAYFLATIEELASRIFKINGITARAARRSIHCRRKCYFRAGGIEGGNDGLGGTLRAGRAKQYVPGRIEICSGYL